ncbi:Chemotaxis protein [Vibrio crassostreae]|nr:Chemotaxis protein [Vibrio crassostreae]CAK2489092.1 Chemotaxis protein [Vibrio crassostreae]
MGGSSKSSNQTNNTTNTSNKNTSNAFNADQNGTVISGVEHSNITVTDGGAVKAALAAMTDASENITKNSQYAIAHNGEIGKYAIAHNSEVSKVAINQSTDLAKALGTHALVNAQSTSKDAMDIMKNLSLQSDAGTAQQVTKYFMFGAVALSVAVALKGRF